MNKLDRGPLGDDTYKIQGSRACGFRQEDLFHILPI